MGCSILQQGLGHSHNTYLITMTTSAKSSVSKQSNRLDMNQDVAQSLFHEGATLIFTDVPKGTEFGIDCNVWTVDHKFKGIKMIPPGIHFVYYSAVSKQNETAPRTGFFYDFKQKEVLIKKWSPQTEDIQPGIVSEDEQRRFEMNKCELDQYLAPYPYDTYKKWVSLSNHVTSDVLIRLQPDNHKISSVTELRSEMSTTQSRKEAADKRMHTDDHDVDRDPDDPRLPAMHSAPEACIHFTDVPKRKYPQGASPAEMTLHSMDHSYVLRSLLDTVYQDNALSILGEVQFAFVCFLLGQVFDAFEQWKQLVHLLCSSEAALTSHPQLYIQFISILHYHIREIPEDFFVDIVTQNNFLVSTLRSFFANLANSTDCKQELKVRGQKFKENLEKRFQWDFGDVADEDQPVVVVI